MTTPVATTGITPQYLENKLFQLVEVAGPVLAPTLSFKPGGVLEGYKVGRHWSWGIENGNLCFYNNHAELTDVFDRFEIIGTQIALVGRFNTLANDYWVRLIEQPMLDRAALVHFRSNTPEIPGRAERVAVLVRSHNADAKFDDLMAKLSRNRLYFDLYAMVDTTRRAVTTTFQPCIYFSAKTCEDMALARPHPDLFHQYGDVAMSYAYRQISGYAYYIMIDDDVDILEEDAALFNDISKAMLEQKNQLDMVGLLYDYRPLTTHGFYLLEMMPEPLLRYCYFPLIGLSARAAAFLFTQRQLEYVRGNSIANRPMCEIFVPSLLHAAGFVCRDLSEILPGAYTEDGMMLQLRGDRFGRPMGFDWSGFKNERMIHPVYTAEEFVRRFERKFHDASAQEKAQMKSLIIEKYGSLILSHIEKLS